MKSPRACKQRIVFSRRFFGIISLVFEINNLEGSKKKREWRGIKMVGLKALFLFSFPLSLSHKERLHTGVK